LSLNPMRARRGMNLTNARHPRPAELWREPHEGRPQSPMHIGDVAVHEACDSDIWRITNRTSESVDFTAPRMRPPRALNLTASDRVHEIWNGTPRSLQHHSVSLYES
jgi:hypothetical protein